MSKPSLKGKKPLGRMKEGGQPTITDLIASKPIEDNKPEMKLTKPSPLQKPNLRNQTLETKPQ